MTPLIAKSNTNSKTPQSLETDISFMFLIFILWPESLLSALAESEHLLGEISVVTRAHQPQVSSFSSAIQALQKAVENEDKELKR